VKKGAEFGSKSQENLQCKTPSKLMIKGRNHPWLNSSQVSGPDPKQPYTDTILRGSEELQPFLSFGPRAAY